MTQSELYRAYYPTLLRICQKYTRDPRDAEEIVNDAFLKIFGAIDTYDPAKGGLYAWMRRIVINTALSAGRGKGIRVIELQQEWSGSWAVNDGLSRLACRNIMDKIGQLPPKGKAVLMLHGIEGRLHSEVSNQLGMSNATSRWWVGEARKRLRGMNVNH